MKNQVNEDGVLRGDAAGTDKTTKFVWGINWQWLAYGDKGRLLGPRQVVPFYSSDDGKPKYKKLSLFRVQIGITEVTDEKGKTRVDYTREKSGASRRSIMLDSRYSFTSCSRASFAGFGIYKDDITRSYGLTEDDAKRFVRGDVFDFSFERDFKMKRNEYPPNLRALYKPVFLTPTDPSTAPGIPGYNLETKTWGDYRPITETWFSSWVFAAYESSGFGMAPVFMEQEVHERCSDAGISEIFVGMANMTMPLDEPAQIAGIPLGEPVQYVETGDALKVCENMSGWDVNRLWPADNPIPCCKFYPQAYPLDEGRDCLVNALDGYEVHRMRGFLGLPQAPLVSTEWY
jgi:hypothetical protein